jgi:tRNA-binding protein
MSSEIKSTVSKEETFDKLEIRVGRIISVETTHAAPKPSYIIKADFGKFGVKTSVGRFTKQSIKELTGKQILGVLNFEPRQIGEIRSEFLCLGVQYPKAESGEAMIISPVIEAKIGGKLF